MEILINEIKQAISNNLYFTALNTALIVPDICAALQSENGKTNGSKYEAWFERYCPDYSNCITGNDIYKIRCASLHQGKLNHDSPRFSKVLFQIPTEKDYVFHRNILNGAINLNLVEFVKDIITGYENWWIENQGNDIVLNNIKASINYYPHGLAPYIIGVPIIG